MATFVVILNEDENEKLIFNDITKLKLFIYETVEDMMFDADMIHNIDVPRQRIHSALQTYFESGLDATDDPFLLDCYLSDLFTIYKKIL